MKLRQVLNEDKRFHWEFSIVWYVGAANRPIRVTAGIFSGVRHLNLLQNAVSKILIMKLLLTCTSGGHFATMRSLRSFWSGHDRVWVTDCKGDTQCLEDESEHVHWLPYQAPRDGLTFLKNLPATLQILRQERPDMVVSTGASVAVNFAIAARLLNIRFLYVESISRAQDLSLSGKLVYPLSNEFYVQWPELCERYPRAIYRGMVA